VPKVGDVPDIVGSTATRVAGDAVARGGVGTGAGDGCASVAAEGGSTALVSGVASGVGEGSARDGVFVATGRGFTSVGDGEASFAPGDEDSVTGVGGGWSREREVGEIGPSVIGGSVLAWG
jgi:hypothetical protein